MAPPGRVLMHNIHEGCDHAYGICSAPGEYRFVPAAERKAQAAYERKLARAAKKGA